MMSRIEDKMTLPDNLLKLKWHILAIILFIYVTHKIQLYYRLRQFKGPFSSGLFDVWNCFAFLGPNVGQSYAEVCKTHGKISRIGPNDLVTTSPELIAHMSAVRSPYTRTPWFYGNSRTFPGKDNLFTLLNETEHMKRRQMMAPGYSGKDSAGLEESIDTQVRDLIGLIRSKYISNKISTKPMDLARKVHFLALDVITDIGMGQKHGFLNADKDLDGFIRETQDGFQFLKMKMALGVTWLLELPGFRQFFWPSEKNPKGLGKISAIGRRLINNRMMNSTEAKSDMIASFSRHGMGKEQLFIESVFQLLAGSDTTATAIRTVMLYIMTHPTVYMKLQSEIDESIQSGRISQLSNIVKDSEARQVRYLQAVIKEAMRLLPPVTIPVPKQVPKGGDTVMIEGKPVSFPGGTNISISVLEMGLRKDIFGEDAESFRPERWILDESEKNQELLFQMNRVSDMIFGYGRYQCLGKPVALMEINKTIFEFMRHFDWGLMYPEKPWTAFNFLGINVQRNMWVRVAERSMV